jgi:hypothetical protein
MDPIENEKNKIKREPFAQIELVIDKLANEILRKVLALN